MTRSWSAHPSLPLVAVALFLACAPSAGAQDTVPWGRMASLSLGASSFDASGTGTAPTAALRVEQPVGARWLLVEGSLGYAQFDEQFAGRKTHFGVLEGQLQAQLPFARVRPYLGVGGGWTSYLSNAGGRDRVNGTASVAAGLRFPVSPRVVARGELRVRGWNRGEELSDGFVNSAAETTIGLAWRF